MPEGLQLRLSSVKGQVIVLIHATITQDTCVHDAKVKMPGYDNMYECTRCHKFIHASTAPKEKEVSRDDTAPKHAENSWEDDYDD